MNTLRQPSFYPFNSAEQASLRQRLDRLIDKRKLFKAIDSDPALVGAGVVFIDSRYNIVTLREFEPVCNIKPIKVVLREPPHAMSSTQYAQEISTTAEKSKLFAEILGTSLACGAAVLSWVVIVGSAGAIPLTGGASTALTVLSYSAFAASALQCGNGVVRTGLEVVNPTFKERLDSEEWYSVATTSLDLISLAGAGAAGFATIRMVSTLRAQGLTVRKALEGLSRPQRARLTEEIVRINHPTASRKMILFLQRTGAFPKRYSRAQISKATQLQLKDAMGALLGFTGSSTSGTVRNIAVAIYEEVD